ncbi:hypothetical protein [Pseudomonas sp. ANT_H12B]|nr:hypothetical protein [Pseudomonas sp. ANT_H12B]
MGYMVSGWNANKVVELEEQETLAPEHIEALQLTEEEMAELDAE